MRIQFIKMLALLLELFFQLQLWSESVMVMTIKEGELYKLELLLLADIKVFCGLLTLGESVTENIHMLAICTMHPSIHLLYLLALHLREMCKGSQLTQRPRHVDAKTHCR